MVLLKSWLGDKNSVCRGPCANRGILMAISTTCSGKGGGLLEKPVIERTTPGRESEFDLRYVPAPLFFLFCILWDLNQTTLASFYEHIVVRIQIDGSWEGELFSSSYHPKFNYKSGIFLWWTFFAWMNTGVDLILFCTV
jgi:hypothetical protein